MKVNFKNGQKFLKVEADLIHSELDIKPFFRGFNKDHLKKLFTLRRL